MKKETMEEKMLALLGLEHLKPKEEPKKDQPKKGKKRGSGGNFPVGVTLDQIEKYRGAQALNLFLQAPELFTARNCKRELCGEPFLVSREHVAFCSYTCMKRDLHERFGIEWNPNNPIDEQFVKRQLEGNEPLIVPPQAIKMLQELLPEQLVSE
jgi:hypothetical protein